ncbi:MAG TPA: DUF4190 domain-containing protein [Amycolatopsis sp.]|uniref:DUF4190 domain-containing protein n=1 Tax=Amycolatopsis sp. TaxID=37632 RepID=UPI002B4A824E|nr:DUF4190 domain-containing protein [Amycolatopsis sp.]HKS46054.1 DUF4190 domain-containing protein [Amycolatopsis sp.]
MHPSRSGQQVLARNGFGLTGFALGLLGLIFSVIPLLGVVAWPLLILGIVFAGIGLARARRKPSDRSLAIAGLVLSVVGLLVCVAWLAGLARLIGNPAGDMTFVRYDVSGTAHAGTITYSAFGEGENATSREYTMLPWSKDIQIKGLLEGSSLTITTGADGGTVTCKVVVNGTEIKQSTASGPFATAVCEGF